MAVPILAFIDLETTGHDTLKLNRYGSLNVWHEIIDIGCVLVRSDTLEVVGEFETLVWPEHPERCIPNIINHYPERATVGEWDDAVPLKKAIRDLFATCAEYSNGEVVVPGGQNWFFDWSFLTVAFAQCGISEDEWMQYLSYKRFDTASMAISALREPHTSLDMSVFSLRSGKLQELLGIEPEPIPHRAINGARQALEVFRKLDALKRLKT